MYLIFLHYICRNFIIYSSTKKRIFIKLELIPFMKQKLRYRELFRFIITGTIITVIHYSIYLALSNFLSLNIAYTTGFIISFVCNFLLSNYYTFQTKPSVKNAIRFCRSHVINYLLQISCFNLFIFLGVPKAYAPMPVWIVILPINFLLVRMALKPSFKLIKKIHTHKNRQTSVKEKHKRRPKRRDP